MTFFAVLSLVAWGVSFGQIVSGGKASPGPSTVALASSVALAVWALA